MTFRLEFLEQLLLLWEAISNTQKSVSLDMQLLWSWFKKNSTAPRFFNPLFSVWISDETLFLVFDILHEEAKNVSVKWLLKILSKTEMIGFVGSRATSSSVRYSYVLYDCVIFAVYFSCSFDQVSSSKTTVWSESTRSRTCAGKAETEHSSSPAGRSWGPPENSWQVISCFELSSNLVESFPVKVVELPRNCHHELS